MAKKLTPSALKALLVAEKADAISAMLATKLSKERTTALEYYKGNVQGDLPSQEGRSQAVSSDVADTIEGLMPSLMEIFAGSDEVVRFDPVSAEDVKAAEQETDYVNHVFMQKNPGFMVLYTFIKDALLSKVGVVKVWWEEKEIEERETYLDQPDDVYQMIAGSPDIEVVEHSEHRDPNYQAPIGMTPPPAPQAGMPIDPAQQALAGPNPPGAMPGAPPNPGAMLPPPPVMPQPPMLHDVTIAIKRTYQCARVEGVPPEEFGIARNARTIKDTDYCFHEVLKSEHALIGEGFDATQVKNLPSYSAQSNPETVARDSVNENTGGESQDAGDRVSRLIKITEHYVRMDYEKNNKPALYRVTTGGEGGEILKRDGQLDIVREDFIPFAAMTPVPITHRFWGRSVADLVLDIQRIKTVLIRAWLDNTYMANNPRPLIAEGEANESTLDDLLVSRLAAPIRAKTTTAVVWQQIPTIGGQLAPLLEYVDSTREWRTGVSRQGQGLDANALQNQTATAANQLFTAAQARMKQIARIFAETGVRDLFWLLHATIRKHGSQPDTVRLRNEWVTVDPRNWKTRNDLTIDVGLGSGGKNEQLAHMNVIAAMQEKLLMASKTNMVSDENVYSTCKAITRLSGQKDVDMFFTDPKGQPAPQTPPDPKLMEIQARMELEKTQAQADAATNLAKQQGEMALAQKKFEHDREMALLNHQLKASDQQFRQLQSAASSASNVGPDGQPSGTGNALLPLLMQHLNKGSAPKRFVKQPDGSFISHAIVDHP